MDERQAALAAKPLEARRTSRRRECRGGRPRRRSPRQAATFDATALAGITTVIGTPACDPAHAYAWPAFPAEIVIAPRDRSSGRQGRDPVASAARGLNEPVFWRCSALRWSRSSASLDPARGRGPCGPPSRATAAACGGPCPAMRSRVALDGGQADDGRRRPCAEYAGSARRRDVTAPCRVGHLRSCAISERLAGVIDTQPTTEADRQRSAAVAPRPRRSQAPVRPRVARRRRALRRRPVDPGRLPGAEHEPAPRGPPHAGLVATRRDGNDGLLSPRRPPGPRGLPAHPGLAR